MKNRVVLLIGPGFLTTVSKTVRFQREPNDSLPSVTSWFHPPASFSSGSGCRVTMTRAASGLPGSPVGLAGLPMPRMPS